MKKYLLLVMIGLSFMLFGCSKDDNNDFDILFIGDIGKVCYEVIVSDLENFKFLVFYIVGVDFFFESLEKVVKEIVVESLFIFE